ncbi:hypothetical protein [Sandaracinus amylolyticus]|uniref:DUF4129 domain-containing protein n=1 Tax=Sandaracinus amylolyticus TaxID=927083 RepID=A0A0F6W0E7_9BACT|nr:hypothetical protein [Sandaracinus amylolyticus]AKF04096.1 hypothetical protein DB32_001245 [Sandaracinus amylolyticus]
MSTAREAWRRDAKELARPALTYLAWVVVMVAMFDLVLLVLEGFSGEVLVMLVVLSASTIAGVLIGQALAIARVRGSALGCATMLWYAGSCVVSGALAAGGPLGGVLIALLFLTPIFVSGGAWSLASSRALFAAWVPLIYGTGAMFAILERDDRVGVWEQGDKWAIWNVTTALILFLTIALLLVYLVMRERHRLHRWRHAPRALLAGTVIERGAARPRLTVMGWVALVVAGLMLTAGTLFIAPYLFRTAPEEGEPDGESQSQEQTEQESEEEIEQSEDGEGDAAAQAERAARALAQAVCPAMIALLLIAAMAAVAWRPVRRLVIVEVLRRPRWRVAPTTRIRMGWRLIEIALGDLGIDADPSVDASELVRRHEAKLGAIDAELLARLRAAAALRDRVAYALALEPDDVERFVGDAERIWVIASNRIELKKEAQNAFRDVG